MRYRIATVGSSTKNKPVIVSDNVATLTPQKIIFLRHLIEEDHFQFIAIAENFLIGKDFPLLKAELLPMETVSLHHSAFEPTCVYTVYLKQATAITTAPNRKRYNTNGRNVFVCT